MNIAELDYYIDEHKGQEKNETINVILQLGGVIAVGENYKDIETEELDRRFRNVAVFLNRTGLKPKMYWKTMIDKVLDNR